MFYKFGKNDIFHNQIKAHPKVNFKIYNQKIIYNNRQEVSGSGVPSGHIDLFELSNNAESDPYPFITKEGSLTSFKSISLSSFNSDFIYGDELTGSYPLSASISIDRFVEGSDRNIISALRNTLDHYRPCSNHYAFSSSLGNKETQELKIISIPSIFYGSQIDKGSVKLQFFVSGTLSAEAVDSYRNGELRQTLPADSNSGSVVGVVLYNEGFMILTASHAIHSTHVEPYDIFDPGTSVTASWIHFGTTGSTTPTDGTNVPSSSFSIDFRGTQYVPVLTMLAHAPKGELNYSSNPTFLDFGQSASFSPVTSSVEYKEFTNLSIKNIAKSNFDEPTASFENVTYISKVGIYDRDYNLIAIAKLARPLRKMESNDYTIKMKIDF